jgi:serine/threonine protein kinase
VTWFLNSRQQIFYAVELLFGESVTLNLCKCKEADDDHLLNAFVWKGDFSEDSLARIFYILARCSLQRKNSFKSLGPNCCLDENSNRVLKIYDYRNRENVSESEKRRPTEFYFSFLQAEFVLNTSNLKIISYPYMHGSHIPSKCTDFVDVLNQLVQMHSRSIVHGDIRLFNILFLNRGGSTLIDFDFSSNNGIYPPGFCIELFDTLRHSDAKPGNVLHIDHDCFSMAAVMNIFSSTNEKWKDAVDFVQNGFLSAAIDLLHIMHDDILVSADLNSILSHEFATGGPMYHKRISLKRARNAFEAR